MGELLGLASAMIWATTNTLLRGQTARLGAVTVNFWRCLVNIPFFLILYLLTRPHDALLHLGWQAAATVLLAVVLGLVTGDSLQFHAIKLIGVSRAMPISGTFPIFTVFFAWLINGDPLRVRMLAGAVVVVMGVLLISLPKRAVASVGIVATPLVAPVQRSVALGVALSLCAAVCWSLSTVLQGRVLANSDPVTVNTLRMPLASLLLFSASRGQTGHPVRRFGWRSFLILVGVALLGTGIGSLTYLGALKLAGAGKTAVLGASAPLFALPLAIIALGERPGTRGIVGTLLTVVGIGLVVSS